MARNMNGAPRGHDEAHDSAPTSQNAEGQDGGAEKSNFTAEQRAEMEAVVRQAVVEAMAGVVEEMKKLRQENEALKQENEALRNGNGRTESNANKKNNSSEDEDKIAKRKERKKGLGIIATIGAAFNRVFGVDKADKYEGESVADETAAMESDADKTAPMPTTVLRSALVSNETKGTTPNKPVDNAGAEDEPNDNKDDDSDKADLDDNPNKPVDNTGAEDEPSDNKDDDSDKADLDDDVEHKERKKGSRRNKIIASIVGLALAVGLGGGVAYYAHNNAQEAKAAKAAEATTSVQNETQDFQDVISSDPATIDENKLNEAMESYNREKSDVARAIENNPNASSESLDAAQSLLDSDEAKNYQDNLQNLIDTYNARKEAAEKLGVDTDTYAELERASNDTGLSVERVKELADYYGVPADKLGTDEAQQYMRDNLLASTNVSEKFNCETPEQAVDVLLFSAYNNKGALAQYVAALNEDGGAPDAGIDGLEVPADVQALYAAYCNDDAARMNDFARLREAAQNVEVASRSATSQTMYSYYLSGDNIMVCSRGPENSGGQTQTIWQYAFKDASGNVLTTILVKNGCGQIEAGKPIPTTPVVVKRVVSTPNRVTTSTPNTPSYTPGTPNTPGNPGKNPAHNDPQQNAAHGYEDNAPANDWTQGTENGIPYPDDAAGNISGNQPSRPNENNAVAGSEGDAGQNANANGPADKAPLTADQAQTEAERQAAIANKLVGE